MEYTNEILMVSLLYIGLMNWMYWREYKKKKERELGMGEGSELLLIIATIVLVWIVLIGTI